MDFLFEINPGLFIWNAIIFIVLVVFLYKYAWGAMKGMVQKRQEAIEESILEAERLKEEATALLADYKAQLGNARQEADEIIERARKVGEATRVEILVDARVQAERMVQRAKEQIDRETRQALTRIRKEVADVTISATESMTRKVLTDQDHLRLIQQSLAELDLTKMNGN